jgi:hypothetical protein
VHLEALRAILRAWTARAVLEEAEKGGDPLEAKYGLDFVVTESGNYGWVNGSGTSEAK